MKHKKDDNRNSPVLPDIDIIDLEDPNSELDIISRSSAEAPGDKEHTGPVSGKRTGFTPVKKETGADKRDREDTWEEIQDFNTFASAADHNSVKSASAGANVTNPDYTDAEDAKPLSTETDTTKPLSTEIDTAKPLNTEADTAKPLSTEADTAKPLNTEADTAKPLSAKTKSTIPKVTEPEDQTDDSWATEDWGQNMETEDEEETPPSPVKGFLSKINWHIVFAVLVLLIIGLVIYRFKTFGKIIDLSQIEGKDENDVLDSILPLILPKETDINVPDDGVTTIVAFGNAPFADDRDSPDNLAALIAEESGATVYNCSVEGSYLTARNSTLNPEAEPMDAFNFYWLTTLLCLNDESVRYNYTRAFQTFGDTPPEGAKEAYHTLTTLDPEKIDVITLMYDGSDYLDGRDMYDDVNPTNIQTFTGNMEAGIELIQQTYPHIRIIVLSPSYVYALDENGEYVASDLYRYGEQDVFSTYVIKQFGSAYNRSVSFVDNLYGSITADNARDYLTDHIHLNLKGRKLIAERFLYALNYYNNEKSQAN